MASAPFKITAADFVNADGSSKINFGSYKNNMKKGTATITIRGLGEYGGTKAVKFKIGARSLWFWWL